MSTTALRHPPSADEHKKGTMLAVVVHVLLLLALALGVNWRSHEATPLSAELWSAVPRIAAPEPATAPAPPPPPVVKPQAEAPKPAPPPPTPREADIVTEKVAKPRPEETQPDEKALAQAREQAREAERRKQEEARKREEARQKEQQARIERQREENLRRLTAQLAGSAPSPSPGTDVVDAGPSASYAGRVRARILPNIIFTDLVPRRAVAEVQVDVAPDGKITGRKLRKSSGVPAWDDAVLRAIDKTETLPLDVDGRVQPSMLIEFDASQR
jgi:colicin import membrane protein